MVIQMRLYTIEAGKMDEWVRGWKAGVYPLRLQHGFSIPGAWVMPETNQFLWMLRYDGPEGWEAKNAAYYDSPERKALNPDPARLIAKQETWFVTQVVP